MATKAPSIGFLPYGSTDDSVMSKTPLTSALSVTDPPASGAPDTRATPSHDSVKGLTSGGYTVNGLTNGDQMENQGQVTFQVQASWFCVGGSGSDGYTATSSQTPLTLDTASGDDFKICSKPNGEDKCTTTIGTTPTVNIDVGYYTGSTGRHLYGTTIGKDEWVTVNAAWWGGKGGGTFILALDGVPVLTQTQPDHTRTTLFDDVWINNFFGQANSGLVTGYYMRNLQFSNKAPIFPVHPKLRHLTIWGDSMVGILDISEQYIYDNCVGNSCLRKLAQKGIYCGAATAKKHTGYYIDTGQANSLDTVRPAMLAENPSIVVLRAGTNDAVTYNSANFETDLKAEITAVMAHPSVEYMFVSNVPSLYGDTASNTAANLADVLIINAICATLESWWDTNNPSNTGKVKVIDSYTNNGGENPPDDTFIGQTTGAMDNVHFSGKGALVEGESYADAILNILGE